MKLTFYRNGKSDSTSLSHEKRLYPWDWFIILLVFGIIFTCNALWLKLDHRPMSWDDSDNYVHCLQLARLVINSPLTGIREILWGKSYFPSLGFIPALLFLKSNDLTFLSFSFYLLILIASVYLLEMLLFDRRRLSIISVLFLFFTPGIYHFSRHFKLDIPLTAMIALVITLIFRSNLFKNTKGSVIAGFVFGLGMLTKFSFAMYFAGPALYLFFWALLRKGDRCRVFFNICLFSLFGMIVFLPWYLNNLDNLIYNFNVKIVKEELSNAMGDPDRFSFAGILFYPTAYLDNLLGVLIVLPTLAGMIIAIIRKNQRAIFLIVWLLTGFLTFAFMANKDIRYGLPFLTPALLLAGYCFSVITSKRLITLIMILLVPLLSLRMTVESFGFPSFYKNMVFNNSFHAIRLACDWENFVPYRGHWPIREITLDILKDHDSESLLKLCVIPDHEMFHHYNFGAEVLLNGYSYEKGILAFPYIVHNPKDVIKLISKARYIIIKTGDQGPEYTTKFNLFSYKLLDKLYLEGCFEVLKTFSLPDRSKAVVYKKIECSHEFVDSRLSELSE